MMNDYRHAVLAMLIGLTGCEAISGPSELERQIALEQSAIKVYSGEVVKVDALNRTFVEAWKKANEKKELKAYKDDLTTNVLPAATAFLKALEAMPLPSESLKQIQAPLVAAYRGAIDALTKFTSVVTEANLDAEYAKVVEAMEAVKKADAVYVDGLKTYYAKNRVDWVRGP